MEPRCARKGQALVRWVLVGRCRRGMLRAGALFFFFFFSKSQNSVDFSFQLSFFSFQNCQAASAVAPCPVCPPDSNNQPPSLSPFALTKVHLSHGGSSSKQSSRRRRRRPDRGAAHLLPERDSRVLLLHPLPLSVYGQCRRAQNRTCLALTVLAAAAAACCCAFVYGLEEPRGLGLRRRAGWGWYCACMKGPDDVGSQPAEKLGSNLT